MDGMADAQSITCIERGTANPLTVPLVTRGEADLIFHQLFHQHRDIPLDVVGTEVGFDVDSIVYLLGPGHLTANVLGFAIDEVP